MNIYFLIVFSICSSMFQSLYLFLYSFNLYFSERKRSNNPDKDRQVKKLGDYWLEKVPYDMQAGKTQISLHKHMRLNHIYLGKRIQTVYTYRQGEKLCFKIFRVRLIFSVKNIIPTMKSL